MTLLVDGVGGRDRRGRGLRPRGSRRATATAGRTERNASMFGPPGHAYVYRSYGIHWCLNLVCERRGSRRGGADPRARADAGLERARAAPRRRRPARALLAGPGRLCQALGITREHDGLPLDRAAVRALERARPVPRSSTGPRIGITRATELPWRYALAGSRFLSRALRPALTRSRGAAATPAARRLRDHLAGAPPRRSARRRRRARAR